MLKNEFGRSGYLCPTDAPDQLVFYEDRGPSDAPAVMMAHGTTGFILDLTKLNLWNKNTTRLIAPHMRGVGQSQPAGATEGNLFPAMSGDIEAVRQTLGVDKMLGFGWSGGAAQIVDYAERYPERITGLVLYGTYLGTRAELNGYYERSAAANPAGWDQLTAFTGEQDVPGVLTALGRDIAGPDPDRAREAVVRHELLFEDPQPAYDDYLETRSHADWDAAHKKREITFHMYDNLYGFADGELEQNLGRLGNIPVLIVRGEDDGVVTPEAGERLAAALPNARLVTIPGVGHDIHDPAVQKALRPLLAGFPAQADKSPVAKAESALTI